jgi:2-polyprenyl-3-methyl-5-hydroxy-6-metoxy-1,4-benzoquinol methylase
MLPDAGATREHWDHQAATYGRDKARNAAYYDALKRLVDRAVPATARRRVLEVGCGTGAVLRHLAPHAGVGIDSSQRMIEEARRPATPGLRFEVMDATAAPTLGHFDAVVCTDVLEHVPDWEAVVDALVGAADRGATIVVSTPNPAWALPLWILEKLHLKMPEGPHRYVNRRAIAARLVERGCAISHAGTHGLIPARLGGIGPRLSTWAESLPLGRTAGVIQLVVGIAGRGPEAALAHERGPARAGPRD